MMAREKEARFAMLEKLADYDDELMEQLLSDIEPPRDRVFADLARELAEGLITPVLFGSAENGNGILRLLKALRHEAPGVDGDRASGSVSTAKRRSRRAGAEDLPYRAWRQAVAGRACLPASCRTASILHGARGQDARVAGVFPLMGQEPRKVAKAPGRRTVALGRLENIADRRDGVDGEGRRPASSSRSVPPEPVYGFAISVADRKDEVKLTGAIAKLIEEDPSLLARAQSGNPRDGTVGAGRDASAGGARAPRREVRRACPLEAAASRL